MYPTQYLYRYLIGLVSPHPLEPLNLSTPLRVYYNTSIEQCTAEYNVPVEPSMDTWENIE